MTLSSGLQIRIPNHQLVLPDYHIDSEGEPFVNGSDRIVLINSLQQINKNDMPILGQVFFSSAYLFVNHDMAQFTLWQSKPTTEKKLSAIGQSCQNDISSSPLPTPSGLPSPQPTNRNRRINKGTMTGIVIGAITGVALCCGAMIKLRMQKRKRFPPNLQAQNDPPLQQSSHGALFVKPELASDRQPPQEMPLTQNPPPLDLSPSELSGSQHPPFSFSISELPGSQHLPSFSLSTPSELPGSQHPPPFSLSPSELPGSRNSGRNRYSGSMPIRSL